MYPFFFFWNCFIILIFFNLQRARYCARPVFFTFDEEEITSRLHVEVPSDLSDFVNALNVKDIVRIRGALEYSREDCCIALKIEKIEVVDDAGVSVKIEQ